MVKVLFIELRKGLIIEVAGGEEQRKGLCNQNVMVVFDTYKWDIVFHVIFNNLLNMCWTVIIKKDFNGLRNEALVVWEGFGFLFGFGLVGYGVGGWGLFVFW